MKNAHEQTTSRQEDRTGVGLGVHEGTPSVVAPARPSFELVVLLLLLSPVLALVHTGCSIDLIYETTTTGTLTDESDEENAETEDDTDSNEETESDAESTDSADSADSADGADSTDSTDSTDSADNAGDDPDALIGPDPSDSVSAE